MLSSRYADTAAYEKKLKTRQNSGMHGTQTWKCSLFTLCAAILGMTVLFREKRFQDRTPGAYIENHWAKQWKELTASLQPSGECIIPAGLKPALADDVANKIGSALGGTNFLAFDAGADAAYWLAKNCGGQTTFIEESRAVLDKQAKDVQQVTRVMQRPKSVVDDEKTLSWLFQANFAHELMADDWDQILVEATDANSMPLIIYAAHKLAGSTTTIFVNDCKKKASELYMKKWLMKDGRKLSRYPNGQGGEMCMLEPVVEGDFPVRPNKRGRDVSPAQAAIVIVSLIVYALVMVSMRIGAIKSIPTPTWNEVQNCKNQKAWQHQYRHQQEIQRRRSSLTGRGTTTK